MESQASFATGCVSGGTTTDGRMNRSSCTRTVSTGTTIHKARFPTSFYVSEKATASRMGDLQS